MTRRAGYSLVDSLIAVALFAALALPLVELVRAGAASVRPREFDVAVAGFAASCLERLAAAPRARDPLRERFAKSTRLEGAELSQLARAVLGNVPASLARTFRDAQAALAIERREREAGLEIWVIEASWFDRGARHARTFFRVTAR